MRRTSFSNISAAIHYCLYRGIIFAMLTLLVTLASSCSDSDDNDYTNDNDGGDYTEQTVFMYMPWSGSSIYQYFLNNISSFEKGIVANKGLKNRKFMVFIAPNAYDAFLIDISYNKGKCERDTLKRYNFNRPDYTTASGISSILGDVMTHAPAIDYSMIIGCHGTGWVPAGTSISYAARKAAPIDERELKTRFFGHSSSSAYQTDITTLAEGIKATGVKMRYILFDDCYMSNVETAYDLREVTDYLVASTCEVMLVGMPYERIASSLLTNDIKGICDGFYSFYSSYMYPYGTIGATDCSEIERMAEIMKAVNASIPASKTIDPSDIQKLDGFSPTVFFDFADYVNKACDDASLLSEFNNQLAKLVPFKAHTEYYYSDYTEKTTLINTFSGLTTSDPTQNNLISELLKRTAWYAATH